MFYSANNSVVTKAKNLTPPTLDFSKVVKTIALNTRWGIIDGNKPINFIITNNLLLSDLKITSNNKNISIRFNSKTGDVLVYSNNDTYDIEQK